MKKIRILREGYEKVGILGRLRKKAGIPKTRSTLPPIPEIRKDRPPDRNYQSEHFETFGIFKRVIRWVIEKRPLAQRYSFDILIR